MCAPPLWFSFSPLKVSQVAELVKKAKSSTNPLDRPVLTSLTPPWNLQWYHSVSRWLPYVSPIRKKPSVDPYDLNDYHQISSLPFHQSVCEVQM